jgi:tetratricopeptide (TPR) repeat protein
MFTKEEQGRVELILNLINQKKLFEAEDDLKRLILLMPDNFFLYNIYGIIFVNKNNYQNAIKYFKKSIKLNPNFSSGFYNAGSAYKKMKDYFNAIIFFKESIKINHDYYDAYFNLGDSYRELGQLNESLDAFFECLKLRKNNPEIYNNLGLVYLSKNELDKAENYFLEAIKLKLDFLQPYYNLGLTFNQKQQYTKAIFFFNKVINFDEPFYRAYSHIAISYARIGDYNNALKNINTFIRLSPTNAHGYYYRGKVNSIFQKKDLALIDYEKAIKIEPFYSEAFNSKGILLESLNKFSEAEKCYDKAIKYKPSDPDPHHNKGLLNLKLKNFTIGWNKYEWRKKLDSRYLNQEEIKKYDTYQVPTLEKLYNKKIFIYGEQGLGDIIQFSRYVKILSDFKVKITFRIRRNLEKLFEDFNNYCELTSEEVEINSFDHVCSLLSLPLILSNSGVDIFNQGPYLEVNKYKNLFWKNKLEDGSFKIGVHWRGNLNNPNLSRSFDLKSFSDISKIKNITLVNLQKDFNSEIDNKDKNVKIRFFQDFDKDDDAFLDSAAIINNLDLIISNDTSIAHLAGAIGKPILLVLNYNADWRWFLDDKTSPWYPSMLLFRQKIDSSWKEPFNEIKNYLENKLLNIKNN